MRRNYVFLLADIIHNFFQEMTKQDMAVAVYNYFHSINITTTDDLFKVAQVGRARNNRKKIMEINYAD